MKIERTKRTLVDEVPYGVYVWEMPDGTWVGDADKNFLSIASTRGNIKRITQLTEAVRSFGIVEGKPLYLSGNRKIDDEEYELQRQRLAWGLIPDQDDVGALVGDMNVRKSG